MPGILRQAARELRNHAGNKEPWTLHQAMAAACVGNRHAHPVAYWQRHDFSDALAEANRHLAEHIDSTLHPERWANQLGDPQAVAELLDEVAAQGDVPVPSPLVLRPWCDRAHFPTDEDGKTVTVLARFSVPFVPTGAALAEMVLVPDWTIVEWLEMRAVDQWTTSFELLDILDGVLDPEDVTEERRVAEATIEAHNRMSDAGVNLTSRWLTDLGRKDPSAKVTTLTELTLSPKAKASS